MFLMMRLRVEEFEFWCSECVRLLWWKFSLVIVWFMCLVVVGEIVDFLLMMCEMVFRFMLVCLVMCCIVGWVVVFMWLLLWVVLFFLFC